MQRNNSRRAGLIMACLLVASTGLFAQTTNSFSVKQAVDFGLQNATQVKNALLDIKVQKQTNREVTAAALPQLNGSINATHYFDIPIQPIPDFIRPQIYGILKDNGVKDANGNVITGPASFPDLPFSVVQPWSAGASVDVQQLLFDGQVFIGLQARSAAMSLASSTADVTKEQIKANIYKVYYQLVVGKKQVTSIEANIERFEKLLADTKEIYKNGFAEKLDVDKVQVQLNNLRTEKIKIDNQLQVGNAGLKFLMNMPMKDSLVLTDTLSEDELKQNILETKYDYKDRKEFQLLTTAIKLNKYNVKRYQLSKIPTIAAFGSYQKNAQRSEFDFFNKGTWYTTSLVGLKISVPIFDGNARNARIQKAKLELAKSNLEQLKQSIDYEAGNAQTNMKTAMLTVDNQKQNMELAEKVYNTTKLKYEQGLGSNQEIYTAQTELKVAQNNYYGALYDAIIAKIDFLKATGKL
jgi:outer membrane protein TolC